MHIMLFQHSPQLIDLIPQKELKIFDDDIRVDEKSSQSKWLIFEQPVAFFEQYKIDKYVIRVRDVNDVDKEVEVVLIKEIKDETV